MRAFDTLTSRVVRAPVADIDTDRIIPARFLKTVGSTGLGTLLFHDWPAFDREAARGAEILVAGENFGCGSSREHAVWALLDFGFRVVIAPSFADIFRNNCAKVGLLTVVLPQEDCDYLISRSEELNSAELVVDLATQTVTTKDGSWTRSFQIDPFVKHCLINGLDEIGLTLQEEPEISAYEQTRSTLYPSTAALA